MRRNGVRGSVGVDEELGKRIGRLCRRCSGSWRCAFGTAQIHAGGWEQCAGWGERLTILTDRYVGLLGVRRGKLLR